MTDKKKFYLAVILAVLGVALLFTGMLLAPMGIIDYSVITGAGEIFLLVAGILGIDAVYSSKLNDIIGKIKDSKQEDK